ncbi:hypothetical protein [Chryseobacterium sp. CFS15]|uniref:hypothetical protein n=1 Tax=Chryseobacterium sp. CFS15 TaxID=2986946 RepID=UPI00280A26F7|nr:hypothetical protein [Chryseobacterium sp. CFS15]MDQ8141105.1 hypothetical protein [Chryseobacterium sp. CFS15]
MKCIILNNQSKNEDALLSDIADFFWNSGHEVVLADGRSSSAECKRDLNDYDCYISIMNDVATPSFFRNHRILLEKTKHLVLIFSYEGVFTSAIPYPHQIFSYEQLNQNSLVEFFEWFKKLNLLFKA